MKNWFLVFGIFSTAALGLDGKDLYTKKLCHTCHGTVEKAPLAPMYPAIFGAKKDCLKAEFQKIKSGARKGMGMVMKPVVANVTTAEAEAILTWVSSQKKNAAYKNPKTTVCL